MIKLDMTRDELRTIVRDEVRCTVDCVYMNYSKVPGVVFINAWTDNPHAVTLPSRGDDVIPNLVGRPGRPSRRSDQGGN